ncbi:MAG: c-type cytochrome [Saprospiraceae bacterium]|nr:c-type cytochrome [Candidatus Vicinibacter affinis]
MTSKKNIFLTLGLTLLLVSCQQDDSNKPVEDEDVLLGGATSIDGAFINIFQQPASNLNEVELQQHLQSDIAFGDQFVTAPNIINGGLGPVFNQTSCESCHVSNGRSPFPSGVNDLRGLLLRLSMPGKGPHNEPLPVPDFGGQLQTKAVFGKSPEAKLSWQEVEEIKTYLDGEKVQLRKFNFSFEQAYKNIPAGMLYSPRMAPPVIGLGLLEAIREEDIVALSDPSDQDGDGISGKPNRVWDVQKQAFATGRFGWKAGQPNLLQQTAAAYNNDMGITNPLFTKEACFGQEQADTLSDDPEIDLKTLKAATFYPQSLAVPKRRNWADAEVKRGKELFFSIRCNSCHQAKFITGTHQDFGFLSQQTIYPYTDLLLHDMGEGLADNRPDFEADGREWKTPALWGIGLTKTVGNHSHFLHDGRARNLEEAIMWHGGEAEASKEAFSKLNKKDRQAVIKFLESL